MKKILIYMLMCVFANNLAAQVSFKLGDTELETDLNTINAKAKVDIGKFKAEMAVKYDIDEKEIETMYTDITLEPAEIYLALEIGKVANKPIDMVLDEYNRNKEQGWGVIAKNLGIKPGTDAFHMLKKNTNSASGKNGLGKSTQNKGKGKK